MPKKSKPAKTESLSGDILDLLWTHVINPDPGGAWLDDALKNSTSAPEPLKTALPAIQRLLATKASREDLGRVARLECYERCFGLLYKLDDPGLKSGQLTGLREQLIKPPARSGKEKEFMAVVWEGIGDADDDGERWAKTSPKATAKDEPFGDVDAAVARLLQAGAQPRDLELFTRWQRFDATVEALRLFERAGITESEELLGLHESILGAEPSGKEARPGSWPLAKQFPVQTTRSADPLTPFLVLKSIVGFCHSPDGKKMMVAPNAGAFRIVHPLTGETLVNISPKGRAACGEFSTDSKRVFMATEPGQIEICDGESGQFISQFKWPGKARGISLLKFPVTDELLVTTVAPDRKGGTTSTYFVADGNNLAPSEPLALPCSKLNTVEFDFSSNGRRLIVFHGSLGEYELLAYEWPSLKPAWIAEPPPDFGPGSLAVSGDGTMIAAASFAGTVVIYDGANGRKIDSFDVSTEPIRAAFHPTERFLALGEYGSGKIKIWNLGQKRVVQEIDTGTGLCHAVRFSPDGEILGAVGDRKSMFWHFAPLTEGC